MNYQASNPESLSETPERLSETKTRSGSPAAAAKKQAAEVLTSGQTNDLGNCGDAVGRAFSEYPPVELEEPLQYTNLSTYLTQQLINGYSCCLALVLCPSAGQQ